MLGALGAVRGAAGAIAIWQFHTGDQLNLYGGAGDAVFGSNYFFSFDDINRPTGGLEDPISLGNVLALGLPALLYSVLTARTLLVRLAAILGAGVVLYALSISLSRMSWFGAVVGVAIAVALLPRGWRLATGLGVSLVVVATVSIAMAAGGQTLVDRFDTALSPTSTELRDPRGRETRLRLWAAGRDIALANPVVGVGFGDLPRELGKYGLDYGSFTHVHSTYLMIAACAGAVGVLALLIILWAFVADVRVGEERTRWRPRARGLSRRDARGLAHGLDDRLSAGGCVVRHRVRRRRRTRSACATPRRRVTVPSVTRVLMLTNSITPDMLGGLNRYVRELSAALVQTGVPVTLRRSGSAQNIRCARSVRTESRSTAMT